MKTRLEDFPTDVLVDSTKSREAVFLHPAQSMFVDRPIAQAFSVVDAKYLSDREAAINQMAAATQRHRTRGTYGLNVGVKYGLMTDDRDAESDELMLWSSPLNDGAPQSTSDTMKRYLETEDPSFKDIALTRPNSWSPATKLWVSHEVRHAMGRAMPTLQLWSPLKPRSLRAGERAEIWGGNYDGFGRVTLEIINQINQQRIREGKTPIRTIHGFGAGIAQRILGMTRFIGDNSEYGIGSVVGMNLALKRGVGGAAIDHMLQNEINEASGVPVPAGHVRVDEPRARKDIDQRGTDTLQMFVRQGLAIKDVSYMYAFMRKYEPTIEDIRKIMERGATVRVVNGLNTGMAMNSIHLLPLNGQLFRLSTIVGMEGQKVGMMANEHAGAVAVASALGVRDYDQLMARLKKP